MKKVVRIWIYKVAEVLKVPDCMKSRSNVYVKQVVKGEFRYYAIEDGEARLTNRREADDYARQSGKKIETWMGYPSWMSNQGHKA